MLSFAGNSIEIRTFHLVHIIWWSTRALCFHVSKRCVSYAVFVVSCASKGPTTATAPSTQHEHFLFGINSTGQIRKIIEQNNTIVIALMSILPREDRSVCPCKWLPRCRLARAGHAESSCQASTSSFLVMLQPLCQTRSCAT